MKTVILVDRENRPLGTEELTKAHTGEGKLHRAFSAYVFRKAGKEILIQRRSDEKMLWPGIWANTCCSHPKPGETPEEAGKRRLGEELGFTCDLKTACSFVYRAQDPEKRGTEHEHVTLLVGRIDGEVLIDPDPKEVKEWKWIPVTELRKRMKDSPHEFAPWFHLGMNALRESLPA